MATPWGAGDPSQLSTNCNWHPQVARHSWLFSNESIRPMDDRKAMAGKWMTVAARKQAQL